LALSGADAGNYTLIQPTTTGNITPAGLTVAEIEAQNKVYDGTNSATLIVSNALLVGVLTGDTVTLDTTNAMGVFADKSVGTDKLVTVSGLTLLGADAAKYTLTQPTTNADITAASLTVTGITANDKVYDGNSTATLNTTGAILVGMMPGDAVALNTVGATGAFTDPDVGTAKTVLVSGSTLSGMDAGNYTLIQPTTTANITQASSATALVSSANPSLQGFSVTFTATATPVEPASTPPPGNVQFYTNGVALGSPVALTDGVGSLSAADLPAGTNTVLAAYLGGSNFLGSSNSLAQLVVVVAGRPSTPSTIGIQNNADGTVTVTFAGTPDAQFVVQASDNLAPGAWENVSTNTAGTDGQWTFTVSTEHYPGRFYRSAIP
jgi:hypothetical protein